MSEDQASGVSPEAANIVAGRQPEDKAPFCPFNQLGGYVCLGGCPNNQARACVDGLDDE